MKRLILLNIVLIGYSCFGTIHYISNAGLVGNTGTSSGSPWPFSKISSITFAAGDQLLFNRGETYYGSISINQSGTAGNPITIGAYGTGANPIITGFSKVSAWTNLGGNIWESTGAVSTLSSLNIVSINGVNTTVGRYPQSTYQTITSHSGTTSLGSALTGTPNFTGGQIVFRSLHDLIDKQIISSQSGGTLNFSSTIVLTNGAGFFIQNNVNTLTYQNAWFYNTSTKKIRIYSTSIPSGVQVATIDNLINVSARNYITVDNIDFRGSNGSALLFTTCSNIKVQNCNVSYGAIDGIQAYGGSTFFTADNNIVTQCNNSGIANYATNDLNPTIINNTVSDCGLLLGMRQTSTHGAIQSDGNNGLIQYNTVDSSGASGIIFIGTNAQARNNFTNHSCLVIDDGGGIYTNGTGTGKVIDGNICLNSIGNSDGTGNSDLDANGIYCDDNSNTYTITNNTVAGNSGAGFLIHNAANITMWGNTAYDNKGAGGQTTRGGIFMVSGAGTTTPMRNININNNILFARDASQYCLFYQNSISVTDAQAYGSSDSNYICRPFGGDAQTLRTLINSTTTYYDLPAWRTFSGNDAHSLGSPKLTTHDSSLFVYNSTSAPVTTSLANNYEDVRGNQYNGSVTVPAYSSVVLIQNGPVTGTNIAPTAHAGIDQSITLPTNTVNLSGSGTDPDGTIASYNWIKISGAGGSFNDSHIANPVFTVGGAGLYSLQLEVFDNQGASGTDNMDVTVNAAPNIPPVANAGADKAISLPVNSVTLFGSGTDADGSVVSYRWAQVSGTGASINSANTASTTISGLTTPGTRTFSLTVTDNNGATNTDNVSAVVSLDAAPSINAGTDQSISVTSTTLNAIATPASGHSYTIAWTKISGTGGTITSPSSLSTSVTGLSGGTYQFMATVTQDDGQTASDNITVTVTLPNIAPVANAGSDQGVTLPTTTATLTGSGTDADGSISSYHWIKTSGPACTIVSPNSATTNISGLTAGVYKFLLTVTDNSGATNSDEVVVTVSDVSSGVINIIITRKKHIYK